MEGLAISSSFLSKTSPLFKFRYPLLLPRISSTSPIAKLDASSALPSHSIGNANAVFLRYAGSSYSPVRIQRFPAFKCSESKAAPTADVPGKLSDGRRSDELLRKVASATSLSLISTIVLTLILHVLAHPAYAVFQPAMAKSGENLARTQLVSSAWTGFLAGCLHTLSGPDHLAALAPLSIGRTRTESAIVGALWGCGHDAGQLIFGLLFLLLKDRLHIEIIRTWGTRVVGLTLLVIGAMGIKEAAEVPAPCIVLENGECDVSMIDPLNTAPAGKKKIGFATFATGIVHGLQPDALLMILPALALPSRVAGAAFLGMFLLGTVFAMGSYTVFLGSCSQALKERVPRITEKLTWAASLVAISMGLAIIVSQFFGFSLY